MACCARSNGSLAAVAASAPSSRHPADGPAKLVVLPLRPRVIAGAGAVLAIAVGVLLTRSPALGIGLVAATLFVPLALTNLPLAIALWVPLVAIEYAQIAGRAPYLATLVIVGAFAGVQLRSGASGDRAKIAPGAWALAALLLWMTFSALWARDVGVVLAGLREYLVAAAALVVLSSSLVRAEQIALVALAFVAGSVLSVLVGLAGVGTPVSTTANAFDAATRGRLSGGAGDPNYLAAMLIPAIALAVALLKHYRDLLTRVGLAVSLIVMVYGLALTESRGGFLAAIVAVVLSIAIAPRRGWAVATAVATLALTGALLSTSPGALQRVTSVDRGGNGRSDLWTVAWRMVEDHPLEGVGLGNYVVRSREYALRRPGALTFSELIIVDKPLVTHNLYLQMLAELGVVGLALLLGVIGWCLRAGLAASRRFERLGEPALAAIARAVVVGTTASLVASFFISNSADTRLFTLLALGPALLMASRRLGAPAQEVASTSR